MACAHRFMRVAMLDGRQSDPLCVDCGARMPPDHGARATKGHLLEVDVFVPLRHSGFDMASGPDQQIEVCSCDMMPRTPEQLAYHMVRRHRWPEGSYLDRS